MLLVINMIMVMMMVRMMAMMVMVRMIIDEYDVDDDTCHDKFSDANASKEDDCKNSDDQPGDEKTCFLLKIIIWELFPHFGISLLQNNFLWKLFSDLEGCFRDWEDHTPPPSCWKIPK